MIKRTILIITGFSGAGRTTILKNLEDIGYRTIDNLPLNFLSTLIDETNYQDNKVLDELAVGIDPRSHDFQANLLHEALKDLHDNKEIDLQLLFLEADEHAIARRYTETRRPHPFKAKTLLESIKTETSLMDPIRNFADHIIDTTQLSADDVKQIIKHMFKMDQMIPLRIELISFAYKYGLPRHADIILDARFLKNPFYQENLKPLTGCHSRVKDYLSKSPQWQSYLEPLQKLVKASLEGFCNNGRSYVTLACGCTGGQHRSVFMVGEIADYLRKLGKTVTVCHRDMPY